MIVPGRSTLFAAMILALLLPLAAIQPALRPLVVAADLALIAACLIIGRRLGKAGITVEREPCSRLQIDRPAQVVFRTENTSRRALVVSIRQHWPSSFDCDQHVLSFTVGAGEVVRTAMTVTPRQRGRHPIQPADIDLQSTGAWGRWRRTLDEDLTVTVYPDLQAVTEYERLRRHRALNLVGLHRMRMIGAGREFDQLREYVRDDEYRNINWKATARRRAPITNVYQAERSQDVMVCLDCGRMMGNPVGALTMLDCAVDAALMLVHSGQRAGDRIGLALFRDTVTGYLKPAAGPTVTSRIVETLVDAHTEPVFPSYTALIAALRANQKKRSMIFLFTDLNDPQLASNLAEVLPLVSRRHVFVVVSLRDAAMQQVASGPVADRRQLYQTLAARQLADERAARVRELIRSGVLVLEADAQSMTIDVINMYLTIKLRQLV
jgi:uncharacterized protein (DUF58 family)